MTCRHAPLAPGDHAWIEPKGIHGLDTLVTVIENNHEQQTMRVRYSSGREEVVSHPLPVIWEYELKDRWLREDIPEIWPHLLSDLAKLREKPWPAAVEGERLEAIASLERVLRRNGALEDDAADALPI